MRIWPAVVSGMVLLATAAYGQQQTVAPTPPLERHILSLNEAGNHQMDVVYHADHSCDITVDGTQRWRCSWSIRTTDGAFCFLQDGGVDAGKEICKQGRLIGRVSYDGSALATAAQGAQMTPTCTAHDQGGRQWCERTYSSAGLLDECLFQVKVRLDRCMQTGVYTTNHGNFNVERR